MAILAAKDITFTYPGGHGPVLKNVSLTVQEGDFIALCGPSGSGKSTLLRLLKQEVAPHGLLEGEIIYNNTPIKDLPGRTAAANIGMVFQDPENQIVMDSVMDELIFGLENIGLNTEKMRKKVAEIVHFFGLEFLLDRPTHELSGGQKQMVNLASVLLMEPRVLLLDEPTSQLDPISAKDFLNMLHRMNEELGIAVVIVEHRLEDVWPLAERVVILEKGGVIHDGSPRDVAAQLTLDKNQALFDYLPFASRLFLRFAAQIDAVSFPITVKEGRQWIQTLNLASKEKQENSLKENRPIILEAKNIDYQYEKMKPRVLDRLSLRLEKNEKLAIVGGNGTGKSTLLKVLSGLIKPQRGHVYFDGKRINGKIIPEIAYLPQNPRLYFSEESVRLEIQKASDQSKLSQEIQEGILTEFNLSSIENRHPYDLSGGEMQKLAMACLFIRQPQILLVDEPTKGLDPESKKRFGHWLQYFSNQGIAIILVTHDIEFAAQYADKVAMMFRGEITSFSDTETFFKGNAFYTTGIDRMTRGTSVPEVLTLEEAERKWAVQNGLLY